MSSNESLISICRILMRENEALKQRVDKLETTVKRTQHGARMWRQFGHQFASLAQTARVMGCELGEVSNHESII